ncbi:uncharacterized protein LOC109817646 [Cajanus cajan]|uniref:uncharacterized protein LOC109817646 n=1 Tax=Cajanus cajan TaxID=3821 RepID=UPI00098D8312|nr:uncharacterized protein LOC109817646 [Cajanus cajan]
MCRVFPTSLKGAALSWYTQLPPRSVDNFDTLVRLFSTQYATSRPHHITSAALSNLRQQDDESLRHFMERFANVSIKIRNLNPEVALHSMLMALKPGPFVDSLCRQLSFLEKDDHSVTLKVLRGCELITPADFFSVHFQASLLLHSFPPEARNLRSRCLLVSDSWLGLKESSTREKSKTHFDQRSKRPRQSQGPRYEFYTPLNAPRINILEEANHADLISLPPLAHNSANADKSKHCRYHRNYGHTIEECWSLKDRIEELIQAGHLGQYIQRGQTSHGGFRGRGRGRDRHPGRYQGRYPNYQGRSEHHNYHQTNAHEESKPSANSADPQHADKSSEGNNIRGVINTIAGGFVGGGSSNSARKRHLRNVHNVDNCSNLEFKPDIPTPPIVFTDNDYEGISLNQDDPMVISVEVANWEVQKTLIDQGSSTDVLYWPTFLKLDIPHSMIQPHSEPLVGFARERVHTREFIELLTSFGTASNSRRVLVKYLLVDAITSYNILIGRPTLNQLGAVVSTPHLTMKFPGTNGQIIAIKANQQLARKCYAESLKITPTKPQLRTTSSTTVAHVDKNEMVELDPRVDMYDHRPSPVDDLLEFQIGKRPG